MPTPTSSPASSARFADTRLAAFWALACAVLIALVWAAAWVKLRDEREQMVATVMNETTLRARSYEEHLLRTVAQIDQLSLSIKYQWEQRDRRLDLEQQYQKGVYPTELYPVAINRDGYAVTSTRRLPSGTYMGDLEFFRRAKATPGSSLLISPPTEGRGGFAGRQTVRFARSFQRPDGSFDGVVMVAVEAEHLVGFGDSAQFAAGDFIAVRFADGPPIAARTAVGEPARLYLARPSFATREGTMIAPGETFLDRQARIVSWRQLDGYPLVALAGTALAPALAASESGSADEVALATMLSLLLVAGAWLGAGAQLRRFSRLRQADEVRATRRLAAIARTDTLTGLPNRNWLNEYLPPALDKARRQARRFALLHVGLDNFKHINDALGHHTGDEVLRSVAASFAALGSGREKLARVGGDEFIVVLENVAGSSEPAALAERLIATIAQLGNGTDWRMFQLRASAGISMFPDDAQDADALLRAADLALHEAKAQGKAQVRQFDIAFAQKLRDRVDTEDALRQAIARDEFVMHYQPRANAQSGQLASMEALLRWQHPQRGMVGPSGFIAIAEQSGLIVPIGEWVVCKVCAQIEAWLAAGLPVKPVSINVSALQLNGTGFRDMLAGALRRHSVPASLVAIELTESSMLDEAGAAESELQELHQMGIELEIDDFGTGYSSLSKLQSLDIDVLKIDQSFVRRLGTDAQAPALALCQSMVSVGHSLGITVVAEGVETETQLQLLRSMGCDQIQGYLVSPPVPAEQIPAMLAQQFFAPLAASPSSTD